MGGLFGKKSTISTSDSKIGALQIQQSTYGIVITVAFGTNRLSGNLFDYVDFTAIPHTETTTSGGKGGGGVTQKNTTHTYSVAGIIGLAEGTCSGIRKIWKDKAITDLSSLGLTFFPGSAGQSPWGYMLTKYPERALHYPQTAYVAGVIDLGSSASLPNLTFEMSGRNIYPGRLDANPKEIISAILSDSQIGIEFPSQYIGDLTQFSTYCIVNGVFFSPVYASQEEAQSTIATLCQAANSEVVWSQGQFKIIPYGLESITGNGVTYTPPYAPIYDLTLDDFVYKEGETPVKVKPNLAADRYNIQAVEIMNRSNDYNVEPIKATDDTDISHRGIRQADPIEMHFVTTQEVGQFAAQSILQRQLYIQKQYEFTLTWRHCLLDPMDVVTITELDFLGLDKVPVRIVDITEDDEFNLTVTAEDCPEGIDSPALYKTQDASRPVISYNVDPGNVNSPVIFNPPAEMTSTGLETWIAANGGKYWGGAAVWVSEDGDTYKRIGTINNPARYGTLVQAVTASSTSIVVQLNDSNFQLQNSTEQGAKNLRTVCWVDGEAIAYSTATLVAIGKYSLTGLVRGAYNTTIAAHAAGGPFKI